MQPNDIRQMSQLGHGDPLWYVARFPLTYHYLSAYKPQGACPNP